MATPVTATVAAVSETVAGVAQLPAASIVATSLEVGGNLLVGAAERQGVAGAARVAELARAGEIQAQMTEARAAANAAWNTLTKVVDDLF